jgi:hypothetical protein
MAIMGRCKLIIFKFRDSNSAFSSKSSQSRFEYQNISNNNAYQSTAANTKSSHYSQYPLKKNLIEMSFDNLKLGKNGRIDSKGIDQNLKPLNRKFIINLHI